MKNWVSLMQFLLSFILFCFIHTSLHSADMDISAVELESRIRGWYTEYKRTAPPSTPTLRRAATFVGHLHATLLQQGSEEGVDLYSKAILAVIGRGAGIGGLKTPRSNTDKSYLLTPQEKAIVRPALIDAERLRRRELDFEQDCFGTRDAYFARAGRNDGGVDALKYHAKKIQNIALQVFSLKVNINDPAQAGNPDLYSHLIESLGHLDLSRSVRVPEIYRVRAANHSLNAFDVFNMAFHDQSAMTEILREWRRPHRDIPLAYFTLQGLPNSIPDDLIASVAVEISSLKPKRLAKRLLVDTKQTKEAILETLRTKEIRGIQSTLILELFLKEYLPEAGGALIPADDLLHLFKLVGNKVDSDPTRPAICLDALERFMNAYPAYPLAQIVGALISGITYSPGDQMTDFYLEGIKTVYREALSRYYPANKGKILESIDPIFQLVFSPGLYPVFSRQCDDLKNAILADLLSTDCLGVRQIGIFANNPWVNTANASELIEKFRIDIQRLQMVDLLAFVENRSIAPACQLHIQSKINELLVDPLQVNSLRIPALHMLNTADWVTPANRVELAKRLRADIETLTQPALSGLMQDLSTPSDLKLLLANRFVELGAWDELTRLLDFNSNDKIVFPGILQLLNDHGQLTAPRIIFAAGVINVSEVANDLLAKATDIAFTREQFDEFSVAIRANRKINPDTAHKWIQEHPYTNPVPNDG